ncbi:MAG: hypothetical protein AAF203_03150 [Pseudomonadota bacterium]
MKKFVFVFVFFCFGITAAAESDLACVIDGTNVAVVENGAVAPINDPKDAELLEAANNEIKTFVECDRVESVDRYRFYDMDGEQGLIDYAVLNCVDEDTYPDSNGPYEEEAFQVSVDITCY